MADIRHDERAVRGHEIVVLQVGRHIKVGPCTTGIADQRCTGTRADRHATHLRTNDIAMSHAPHIQRTLHPTQEFLRSNRLGKVADYTEAHANIGYHNPRRIP